MAVKNIINNNAALADFLLQNGKTISETEASTRITVEEIYIKAFGNNIALHYKDGRCTNKTTFIEAKPDGSEDLVSLNVETDEFSFIKKLESPGRGKWAYLLNDPRYLALKQNATQILQHA